RDEMDEAADPAARVLRHDQDALRIVPEGVHRHREPALGPAAAPLRGDTSDLAAQVGVHVPDGERAHGEARLAEPAHRLAHLADRPPLERELRWTHDRLVAEVHGVEAELAVERNERLARAECGDA